MTRILVIEDEDPIREDIIEILELEGYEVYGAQNGRRGVELARQVLPDLVLCDIMMPELDGFGVLFELRSDTLTATVPFLFLTARTERVDMRRGMVLGADDYVTKPFTITELMEAIRARLEKHQQITQKYQSQINTLRDAITSTLPHELRTPLTAIMGYTSFILEEPAAIEEHHLVQMMTSIFNAGKRMGRLIENYLTYVQFEFTELKPETLRALRQHSRQNPVYPAAALQAAAQEKAGEFGRESDLILNIEESKVQISERDLMKIAEELIDNGFRFSNSGARVEVYSGMQDGHFYLRVQDYGRGMTAEQIDSLGAYIQYNRKQYEQQGVGLGLTVARGLIDLHGGTVTIDSIYGEGTLVTVSFPWLD